MTGFDQKLAETRNPVFAVDKNRKPMVGYVSMDAKLTVVDSVYENVYGAPNPDKIAPIDTVNRMDTATMGNKLILETPQLADTPTVSYTDAQATNGAFTVIKNIKGFGDGSVKLGQVYEGDVVSVTATSTAFKSMAVPSDGVVLASQGTKASWIKANVKPGDKVRFTVNLRNLQGEVLELKDVVTSWGSLVEGGKALTEQQLIDKYGSASHIQAPDKARTAIGVTKDNKVVALAVDGGGAAKDSYGMTLPDMASMLEELGVEAAVSLDGGGSTQMNARLYGQTDVGVVDSPSDGDERIVTNSILFTSSAPKTYEISQLKVEKDIVIYKNDTYPFQVKGTDLAGNPVDLKQADVQWSVKSADGSTSPGGTGSIDSTGLYKAGGVPANETVYARIGSVEGSAKVSVVDSVYSLGLTDSGTIAIEANKTRAFELKAAAEDGRPIVISNASAQWVVSPSSLGTFDGNGVLTTGTAKGQGKVTAKVGDKEVQLDIMVGQDAQLIDGYESNDPSRYYIDGYVGGTHRVTSEQVKDGKYSLRVDYDYSKWTKVYNGTINVRTYAAAKGADYTTTIRPKKLGMWVYGDGQAPWSRAIITDGNGANRTLDMVSNINWTGWKYVDAVIPGDVPMPITLNYFYMVETDKSKNLKGTVYFDDIRFAYSEDEDLKEPAYNTLLPSASTVYSVDVPFSVNLTDDKTGIDPASITVQLDGTAVPVDDGSAGSAHYDAATGTLTYAAKGLAEGDHTFTVSASDKTGNRMNPPVSKTVTVNLQPDTAPPVISGLLPYNGNALKASKPKLSAVVKDVQSGVYSRDIGMTLDGAALNVNYDEASGWAYAIPDRTLEPGSHTFSVTAKDKAGNAAAAQSVTFTVMPFVQPKDPDHFVFSVTSDTHATGFAPLMFGRINADASELVLQNGDLVDNDNTAQWTAGRSQIAGLTKPYMISPGNHEGFNNNLTNYITYFGDPTYSFEYGNTLFISLNSALGQSLSGPDPSQFDYLQKVLDGNTKPNVVVYTHNTTRDTFGTAHQMLASDADRFEQILGDYKKAHPDRSVNAIFGHLHVSQTWEKDGVTYTISGDGALKKYVTPENGGYLSYTQFKVDGNQVTHKFLPLTQRISVMDSALQADGTLILAKGANRPINVYGDFTALTADYIVNLSKFKDVDKSFVSSDSRIVSVTADGMLTANQPGTARIDITVSGVTTALNVKVVDQNQVAPIRVSITPEEETLNGNDKLSFGATGYDVFGNTIALDSKQCAVERHEWHRPDRERYVHGG
ncbi:phosphodiester glycosidase family protein [Paenibacillus sp. P25]|nr:phosphodiester glycosidase family protein [Paenibacillus sp. P25]